MGTSSSTVVGGERLRGDACCLQVPSYEGAFRALSSDEFLARAIDDEKVYAHGLSTAQGRRMMAVGAFGDLDFDRSHGRSSPGNEAGAGRRASSRAAGSRGLPLGRFFGGPFEDPVAELSRRREAVETLRALRRVPMEVLVLAVAQSLQDVTLRAPHTLAQLAGLASCPVVERIDMGGAVVAARVPGTSPALHLTRPITISNGGIELQVSVPDAMSVSLDMGEHAYDALEHPPPDGADGAQSAPVDAALGDGRVHLADGLVKIDAVGVVFENLRIRAAYVPEGRPVLEPGGEQPPGGPRLRTAVVHVAPGASAHMSHVTIMGSPRPIPGPMTQPYPHCVTASLLWCQGSRVVLQHVVVYGAGQDGVACTHGAHVVAERVQVHDCVMAGLLATGHGTRADVNAGSLTSCRWGLSCCRGATVSASVPPQMGHNESDIILDMGDVEAPPAEPIPPLPPAPGIVNLEFPAPLEHQPGAPGAAPYAAIGGGGGGPHHEDEAGGDAEGGEELPGMPETPELHESDVGVGAHTAPVEEEAGPSGSGIGQAWGSGGGGQADEDRVGMASGPSGAEEDRAAGPSAGPSVPPATRAPSTRPVYLAVHTYPTFAAEMSAVAAQMQEQGLDQVQVFQGGPPAGEGGSQGEGGGAPGGGGTGGGENVDM